MPTLHIRDPGRQTGGASGNSVMEATPGVEVDGLRRTDSRYVVDDINAGLPGVSGRASPIPRRPAIATSRLHAGYSERVSDLTARGPAALVPEVGEHSRRILEMRQWSCSDAGPEACSFSADGVHVLEQPLPARLMVPYKLALPRPEPPVRTVTAVAVSGGALGTQATGRVVVGRRRAVGPGLSERCRRGDEQYDAEPEGQYEAFYGQVSVSHDDVPPSLVMVSGPVIAGSGVS